MIVLLSLIAAVFSAVSPSSGSTDERLLQQGRQAQTGAESEAFFQALIADKSAGARVPEAFFRLGEIRYAEGRYAEAAAFFRRGAESGKGSPLRAETLSRLGLSLMADGRDDSAQAVFMTLTEKDPPAFIAAQVGLAQILEKRKQRQKAIACLQNALALGDNTLRSTVYFLLYRLFRDEGDPGVANAYCMKLAAEFPFSLEAKELKKESGGECGRPPENRRMDSKPASAKNSGYAIQVGAFSIPENAEKMRDKLKMEFPEVTVVELTGDKSRLYAVWVGTFEKDSDAHVYARDNLKMAPGAYRVKKKDEP